MNWSDNLFVPLHHWATRQDENFTTEVFVYLLKYLQVNEKASFHRFASNLSRNLLETISDGNHEIAITTQVRNNSTIQDIQLKTSDKLVFVEVKVGSPLERKQVEAYLDFLKQTSYKPENTLLVCLTRSPISSETTDGTYPIRWYQVARWLEQEAELVESGTCKFLISNFIEFLAYQKATLTKVSSPVSAGISKYRNQAGENSILHKRFKSLEKLLTVDELLPLYDFMLLIFESLRSFTDEKKISFDSSNDISGAGEVMFNINNGQYFIWVEYDYPEVLRLSTYKRVADQSEDDLKFGRIVYEKKYKRFRWRNDVALPKDFINWDRQEQLNSLSKIVSENLNFAKSVTYLQD